MHDPTDGCPGCGAVDTDHTRDCVPQLLLLIELYGDKRENKGQLAGTRYAHFASARDREADALLDQIRELLTG